MINNISISLALATLLAVLGCKTPAPLSTVQHDEHEPTWHGAFDYLDMSFADYTRSTTGPFLAEDHALNAYVQRWLDHIDGILRAKYPDRMQGIPAPRSAVRRVPQVGAFTAGGKKVCYEVPLRISPDVAISPLTTLKGISAAGGRLSPVSYPLCQSIAVDPDRYEEFARWYNQRFAPCQLTHAEGADPDDRLVMTGPCRQEDFFPTKALANRLVVDVAPNRILIFAGTFTALASEGEFVATLAHEMAHYYRAHVVNQSKYNFCYQITPENHGHRPVPDPSLDDLCDKLHPRIGFSPADAAARRLGYYTIEQEADELALEFMAYAGVEPDVAVGAWFSLATGFDRAASPDEIPPDECRALRANQWRDASGADVFVPIGDYRDSHHSWCYRIRNTDREIAAHRYQVAAGTLTALPWHEVQKLAAEL